MSGRSRAGVGAWSPVQVLALSVALAGMFATPAAAQSEAPAQGPAAADTAVFAGGCFWCMEPPYDEMDGVLATISGYAGGHVVDPTYEEVTGGDTGHREVVMVVYDSTRVSYPELLSVFWRNVDPLDEGGQFCDRGFSYSTAIYARDPNQLEQATASEEAIADRFGEEVVTEIVRDNTFYPAEEYHQDYYEKNPLRYKFYRWRCGRDDRLRELWGTDS